MKLDKIEHYSTTWSHSFVKQRGQSYEYSVYLVVENAMIPLASESGMKENADLDADYIILASIDSSSDDESDENDVFNVSCHGNNFKRMKEEPNQCDEFTIKRRKLHTQLDLMNSILMSITFGGNMTSSDAVSSVSNLKRPDSRKTQNKRLARKAKI